LGPAWYGTILAYKRKGGTCAVAGKVLGGYDTWYDRQMAMYRPSFFIDRRHYLDVMFVWRKYGQPDSQLRMIARKGALAYVKHKSGCKDG
jgi:hypothetical protein